MLKGMRQMYIQVYWRICQCADRQNIFKPWHRLYRSTHPSPRRWTFLTSEHRKQASQDAERLRTASFIYLPLVDYSAACMVCGNDIPQYCKKRQQICLGLAAHAYSSTDWSDRSYAPPASQWWLLVMSWNADRATMLVQNWIELEVASWRSSQPFDSAKRWEPMLQRH
jgi:hypothetical protein